MLQPNPSSSSVAQACCTSFMLEVLRERGGRAAKDGSVARRLVPLIPRTWKLQLCFQQWQQGRRKVSSISSVPRGRPHSNPDNVMGGSPSFVCTLGPCQLITGGSQGSASAGERELTDGNREGAIYWGSVWCSGVFVLGTVLAY